MIKQDDELDKLEENIRILKNKYDQFFGGRSKLPPSQERRNIEAYIHELSKQKMRDNTRRFRFNTLLTRYNQFREMWSRRMREREEGPLEFRKRQAAMEEPLAPAPASHVPDPEPAVTSPRPDPYVRVARGTNGEAARALFEQIEKEHLKLGRLTNVTVEQVRDMIEKQSEVIRTRYNVSTVAFRVDTVDGKVKIKAKPLQE